MKIDKIRTVPISVYSPELQRFISEDPIGLAAGINQFTYVENNPINRTDLLGLESISPIREDHPTIKSYVKCKKKANKFKEKCSKDFSDCLNDCNRIPNACEGDVQALVGICDLSCHGDFLVCMVGYEIWSLRCELDDPILLRPKPPVMPGK